MENRIHRKFEFFKISLLPRLVIAGAALPFFASALIEVCGADIFQLQDGGQIVGQLVGRSEAGEFFVATKEGARVTLSKKQVRRHYTQNENQLEYEQRGRSIADTVQAHRDLATWCKLNQLSKLADHHLRRILEIDPEDEQARLGLGYQQRNGRWLTRDETMAERGMQKYDGRFRTPQDIALRKWGKETKEAEAEWFRRLRLWHKWLGDRRDSRVDEAQTQIASVRDPDATPAVVKLLQAENDPQVLELLTETLAQLDHPLAITTLVAMSLEEPDREVRRQCVDYLLADDRPISLSPYTKALKHGDNTIVNQAAEALRMIGDPEAISPLIDALVTTHKYKNDDAAPGRINAGMSRNSAGGGGGGLSFGSRGPQIIERDEPNLEVLQALVELSGGQDFGYDKRAWRRWYINGQMHDRLDARRDL